MSRDNVSVNSAEESMQRSCVSICKNSSCSIQNHLHATYPIMYQEDQLSVLYATDE